MLEILRDRQLQICMPNRRRDDYYYFDAPEKPIGEKLFIIDFKIDIELTLVLEIYKNYKTNKINFYSNKTTCNSSKNCS